MYRFLVTGHCSADCTVPVWRSFPLRPNRSSVDSSSLGQLHWAALFPAWASASALALASVDAAAAAGAAEADMAAGGSCQEAPRCRLAVAGAWLVAGRLPFRSCDAERLLRPETGPHLHSEHGPDMGRHGAGWM